MSTLQVANIWFESTANNRLQYSGSNSFVLVAGGANTLTVNSNAVAVISAATFSNTVTITGDTTVAGNFSMASSFKRNRIINGNMLLNQYNGTTSVTPTASTYNMDRWTAQMTQASKFSIQQVALSTLPGFTYSQNFTVVTPYTVGAGDYFGTEQRIEGYNFADLAWGTANAKSVTLSFWVYANNTGTYCGSLFTSTGSYVYNYTVSAANTWQYVTVTIPGSTAYSLGSTTNSTAVIVRWTFTAGSNFQTTAGSWVSGNYAVTSGAFNWIGTSSATFYITGVQLEVGTKATPYEMQIYSDQLAQCQRYYQNTPYTIGGAQSFAGQILYFALNLPVYMRSSPTLTINGSATTGGMNGQPSGSANAQSLYFYTNLFSAILSNGTAFGNYILNAEL